VISQIFVFAGLDHRQGEINPYGIFFIKPKEVIMGRVVSEHVAQPQ
jgi:hypothetical protein